MVRAAVGIAIAVSAPGCSPKIHRFDATPRHVCPGDHVALVWDVAGTATMTVTPPAPDAPSGPVRDVDTAVIRPTAPTKVSLQVAGTRGPPIGAQLDIEMAQGETVTASIADPNATCHDGVVTSTAHIRNFASDLVVSVVHVPPGNTRAGYDITRVDPRTQQEVTAHVAPDAPTTRFAGLPIVGDWLVSSTLLPSESCDPPRLPANLAVVAYTKCGEEGTP